MNGTRRAASALTGRPPREQLGERTRLADIAASVSRGDADLDCDVSSSLETINKVTETYGILLDKLSAYEIRVRELTRKLSDEERATGDALRAAARAEEIAREAQARAARVETEAARSAETVRELERQLAALRAQTAKLMDAVDQLFPDEDARHAELTRNLHVVR